MDAKTEKQAKIDLKNFEDKLNEMKIYEDNSIMKVRAIFTCYY